jgi:DNA-binding winged helix-turn-helix (wHTH) protein/Tol biopolymer transport system component
MAGQEEQLYAFGDFRLDVRGRSLTRQGKEVAVAGRNFDLLLYLVENHGRILDYDELLDRVWPGTFVEQATLQKGVSSLRQALSNADAPELIKTIPRRGYSFVSPVSRVAREVEITYERKIERQVVVGEYEEYDDALEVRPSSAPVSELSTNTAPRPWVRRVTVIAAVAVLTMAAVVGWRIYASRANRSVFTADTIRIIPITSNGKATASAIISLDGSYILYATIEAGGEVLWLRQTKTSSATKLTPPAPGSFWAFGFAPDNSYVYYVFSGANDGEKGNLYKVPLLGGEAQKIVEDAAGMAPSPDGKRIAFTRIPGRIVTVNTNGGDEHTVVTLPSDVQVMHMAWNQDGSRLLCTFRKFGGSQYVTWISEIIPETGQEIAILPPQDRIINGAVWLPDRPALLLNIREANAEIRQIWEYDLPDRSWRRVTNDNDSYKFSALTSDGGQLASLRDSIENSIQVTSGESPISTTRGSLIKESAFRPINDAVGSYINIGWLANGDLFYIATENQEEAVYTVRADGAIARPITDGRDGIRLYPLPTGDRANVTYMSSRSGNRQIWRVDPGGKSPMQVTSAAPQLFNTAILRDNATVFYTASRNAQTRLYEQTADGQTKVLTDADTGSFAISPDELFLAVEVLDQSAKKLLVQLRSLADNKVIRSFDFQVNRRLTFTPDGGGLAYDLRNGDVSQIMIQPVDGSQPFALTDFASQIVVDFDWSADGKKLAVIRGRAMGDVVLIKANAN